MPSGRLVICVPYDPFFEMPDEGATNGMPQGSSPYASQAQLAFRLG
jgi:hypothetical protein